MAFLGSLSCGLAKTALKGVAMISVDGQIYFVSARNKQEFIILERPRETICAMDTPS